MFFTLSENTSPFVNIYDIISLFAIELEGLKIGKRSKGLRRITVQNYLKSGHKCKTSGRDKSERTHEHIHMHSSDLVTYMSRSMQAGSTIKQL